MDHKSFYEKIFYSFAKISLWRNVACLSIKVHDIKIHYMILVTLRGIIKQIFSPLLEEGV